MNDSEPSLARKILLEVDDGWKSSDVELLANGIILGLINIHTGHYCSAAKITRRLGIDGL